MKSTLYYYTYTYKIQNKESLKYLYKNFIIHNNFWKFCHNQTNFCS